MSIVNKTITFFVAIVLIVAIYSDLLSFETISFRKKSSFCKDLFGTPSPLPARMNRSDGERAGVRPVADFKKQQLTNSRVKSAYTEKWSLVKRSIAEAGIDTSTFHIFIRVFKKEAKLELWAANNTKGLYKKIKDYSICSSSGELGPKRMQGDGQVPEGFYTVSAFNPWSNYHLSLGVSYPNSSDKILGKKGDLGGDIMIHGNCVTIGCMPLTDDKIKEVYVYAVEARSNGQAEIPVHIFPSKLDDINFEILKKEYQNNKGLIDFWKNLKGGYDFFESKKILPSIFVNAKGDYSFK
jgi:murein L,D-transpeptidase YafK